MEECDSIRGVDTVLIRLRNGTRVAWNPCQSDEATAASGTCHVGYSRYAVDRCLYRSTFNLLRLLSNEEWRVRKLASPSISYS
jgi:hypothetical protein